LATTASAALDPHLQLYGRWDRRDADRAITVNSGSHIVARFAGTGATARFDVSKNRAPFPTIAWRIDDQPWKRGEVAESVELAKGLENKAHALMLFVQDLDEHQPRWSPPLTASVTFLGIDVAEGKLVDPPAEPKLKIEFLGDSITEGVLVHHRQPGKTWPWLGDGRIAYPTQTAERLKAQWRQCGFGALGVTRPGNGGVPPDSFNFFYQDCPRDAWEADVVVVNQGTNDGAAAADPFRAAYGKLLDEIRKAYPHAQIAALRPFAGTHAADIAAEVKVRNDAGDTEVYFIDSTGWLESGDFTDGVHPNVRGSGKAADKLAAALRETLKLK
jgi:lysophospholipase L1-like esterase